MSMESPHNDIKGLIRYLYYYYYMKLCLISTEYSWI